MVLRSYRLQVSFNSEDGNAIKGLLGILKRLIRDTYLIQGSFTIPL